MLILKAVLKENRTTRNRFVWPEVGGTVEAPDWDEAPNCGAGLHGWLNGIGDAGVCNYSFDACTFLVVETTGPVVDLTGKVKFRSGVVVFEGSMREAAAYIIEETGERGPVIGAHRVVADGGSAMVGAYGSVDAGNDCTVTAGPYCTVKAGSYSTVTAGDRCTVKAGGCCTVTAGDRCTVKAGPYCTVKAGGCCTVTADYGCTVTFMYYEGRQRVLVAYIGEDGVEPNQAYHLDRNHKLIKV